MSTAPGVKRVCVCVYVWQDHNNLTGQEGNGQGNGKRSHGSMKLMTLTEGNESFRFRETIVRRGHSISEKINPPVPQTMQTASAVSCLLVKYCYPSGETGPGGTLGGKRQTIFSHPCLLVGRYFAFLIEMNVVRGRLFGCKGGNRLE